MVVLLFGKNKGFHIKDVNTRYLWFLTCWELDGTKRQSVWQKWSFSGQQTFREKLRLIMDQTECNFEKARLWVATHSYHVVERARDIWKARHLCAECHRVLVAIGDARKGGAGHDDWEGRYLHKKCYRDLVAANER